MKKTKKVTRITYSDGLNQTKYDALNQIAKRCGTIASTEIWRNYGSISGLSARFYPIRNNWMANQHIKNLPNTIWRITLDDTLADIKANREAAKEQLKHHLYRNITDKQTRNELIIKLKDDTLWIKDSYLRRA